MTGKQLPRVWLRRDDLADLVKCGAGCEAEVQTLYSPQALVVTHMDEYVPAFLVSDLEAKLKVAERSMKAGEALLRDLITEVNYLRQQERRRGHYSNALVAVDTELANRILAEYKDALKQIARGKET
jgi:hypothetical protein